MMITITKGENSISIGVVSLCIVCLTACSIADYLTRGNKASK